MSELSLTTMNKSYGSMHVLKDISLDISEGSFIALLGPSGCGKSTLLRLIAGLERPDKGSIRLDGNDITLLPPEKRDIALMFQSYALMPHMSVFENVRFPLRMKNSETKSSQAEKVNTALQQVQLDGYSNRYPRQLSGGQQQRVALARAIVAEPKVLLLDEPLSNLDARLREDMQVELKQLHGRLKLTTVFVTHDQTEALALADRVILMNQGHIEQADPPEELYARPRTVFAARFIGSANVLEASIEHKNGGTIAILADGSRIALSEHAARSQGKCSFMVRQEAIHFNPAETGAVCLSGTIETQNFLGSVTRSILQFAGTRLTAITPAEQTPRQLGPVTFGWKTENFLPLESTDMP